MVRYAKNQNSSMYLKTNSINSTNGVIHFMLMDFEL